MLPECQGGHRIAWAHHYRPNHNFGDSENRRFFVGQVDVGSDDLLPGESRDVTVTFLRVEGLLDELSPGRQWRVQEGTRLVGMAELRRVVQA